MNPFKARLLPIALLLACCSIVALSYWTPTARAEAKNTLCIDEEEFEEVEGFDRERRRDRDDDEEFEDEENEEEWEEEEEWDEEEWGMEEAMFEVEILNQHLEMVNKLIEIVNGSQEVTTDPTATALMALITGKDLFYEPEDYVDFLEEELPRVKDVAVRRAIHLQLAESYAEFDMPEKSREHLSVLIRGED
ncbi:MAG: hypothetical protein AAGI37_15145 [Planctomycetota bacterium]